jgi:hypothetical protein
MEQLVITISRCFLNDFIFCSRRNKMLPGAEGAAKYFIRVIKFKVMMPVKHMHAPHHPHLITETVPGEDSSVIKE